MSTTTTTGARASRRSVALTIGLMLVFLLYSLAPVWWLLVSSTKSLSDLYGTFGLGFAHMHLGSNISRTLSYDNHIFLRWMLNSVLYAGLGSAGATAVSIAAGYGLAKFRFRGRGAMFAVTIGASLLPSTLLALPLYLLFSKIGLVGSVWSLYIPYFVNPFCVYLARVYAESSIPDELLEAARIDGAGELRIFRSISLKLMVTGAATIFMLDFIGIWNNFFLPLFMLNGEQTYPVTLGLYDWNLSVLHSHDMTSLVITGSLLSVLPLAVFIISMQKYWRSGILVGSVR
ncbi:carbohydrate ABC transporter permease [Streptacidiphilus sp. EB103A]|uniref:carbohydrate ABC transporter permease n=1 Tax=Streptacidiphilus sp. EB103A TaxID=3156275 RepID=UPI003511CA76